MRIEFSPYDVVHVCIPAASGNPADPAIELEGWVEAVITKTTFRIVVETRGHQIVMPVARLLIRKSTPRGLLEFDAVGHSPACSEKLTLTVDLVGMHRNVQRRDSCRIGVGSGARYRNLTVTTSDEETWKTAVLHNVSLGGASMQVQDQQLELGHELMVEFTLGCTPFTLRAFVCRLGQRIGNSQGCCSLQFLNVDSLQQDRIAKEWARVQLKIINSRVKTD